MTPTDKYEIINIISSLDPNKSTGPNSIPTKILKLLKNDISTQLYVFMFLSQQVFFYLYSKKQKFFLFIKNNLN